MPPWLANDAQLSIENREVDSIRAPGRTAWPRTAAGVIFATLLIAFLVFQLNHLGGFAWDFDEGIELSKAWLMLDGYQLYTDIWADQPPGHTTLIALAFRFFGVSMAPARAVTVIFGVVGLIAAAWCVRELNGGWTGALAAAATLAVAPNYFWASRAVMKGLIHFVIATLAIGLALTAHRTRQPRWFAASGFVFSCALVVKLQMIYLAPLLGLLVILAYRDTPRDLIDGPGLRSTLGLLLGAAIPLAITALLYDPRAMFDQVVLTYFETRGAFPVDLAGNLGKIWTYLTADNLGLSGLAAFGVLSVLVKPSERRLVVVVWLGLTIATAAQHAPLWLQDHFLPILLVMSILAGIGVADLLRRLPSTTPTGRRRRRLLTICGVAAVVLYLVTFNRVLQTDAMLLSARSYDNDGTLRHPEARDQAEAERRAQRFAAGVTYVQANSTPDAWVVTDYQVLAFWANRRVPPGLAAISTRRIDIGRLDAAALMRAVEQYEPSIVLTWTEQLDSFDSFMNWLSTRYEPAADFGSHRQAYRLKDIALTPQHPRSVRLGEDIVLLGYTAPDSVAAGESLAVTLYWRAERPVLADYSVFNHLVDTAGELQAQRDGLAGRNHPTSRWVPGVTVVDHYMIPIDSDIPPGNYLLRSGMYELATLQRLPVGDPVADPSGQNAVDLGEIHVTRPTAVNTQFPRDIEN